MLYVFWWCSPYRLTRWVSQVDHNLHCSSIQQQAFISVIVQLYALLGGKTSAWAQHITFPVTKHNKHCVIVAVAHHSESQWVFPCVHLDDITCKTSWNLTKRWNLLSLSAFFFSQSDFHFLSSPLNTTLSNGVSSVTMSPSSTPSKRTPYPTSCWEESWSPSHWSW